MRDIMPPPSPVTDRDIMPYSELQTIIESAFDERARITPANVSAETRAAVERVIGLLDAGTLRVAEKLDGTWRVNEWLKKAVLLSFRIADNALVEAGAPEFFYKRRAVCTQGGAAGAGGGRAAL